MDRSFTTPALTVLADQLKQLFTSVEILDDMLDGSVIAKRDTGILVLPILVDGKPKTLRLEAPLTDPDPTAPAHGPADSRWDLLTGVYNRNTFCKKVVGRLAQGHSTVLALVQVDDFPALVKRYGRDTADKLLCAVADVCRRVCAQNGRDMVCRMSDCVFAISCYDRNVYDMEARMRRLPKPLLCPLNDGNEIPFTVSVACTGTDEVLSKVWPDLYALCNDRLRQIVAKGGNDVFEIHCFSE